GLGDDGTGEQGSGIHAEDGDHRHHGGAQAVFDHYDAAWHALCPGSADVRLCHGLDHGAAALAGVHRCVEEGQGGPGEQKVGRPSERVAAYRDVRGIRQEPSDPDQPVDEHDRGEVDGEGGGGYGAYHQRPVEQSALLECGGHPCAQSQDEPHAGGAESQGGGDGETVHQQAPHRQGVFVGVAQARETAVDGVGAAAQVPAGEDAGEVVTELTPDGLIESHEVTYLCESFGTACLAAGGSGGVGWEEIEDDEGDCA